MKEAYYEDAGLDTEVLLLQLEKEFRDRQVKRERSLCYWERMHMGMMDHKRCG